MSRSLARRLLAWYDHNKRALPWRASRDPYHIWVAEVMLQQTQVETVIPYYQRWLAQFPSVAALAAASQRSVLAAWEGLGYYARARNLHRAAQRVMTALNGALPRTPEGLRALPGIGRYTAGAVASIAFGAAAAVLDGNVKRVLARVFDFQEAVKSTAGEKKLWALAESLLPSGRAGDFNQALMDLGATVCTLRAPACAVCPLRKVCQAYALGVQLERPVRAPKRPVPQRASLAAVVRKRGRVLIEQRPAGELLGGLWAFPAVPDEAPQAGAALRRGLRAGWGLRLAIGAHAQTVRHGFTHFRLTVRVFDCQWQSGALKRGGRLSRWVCVGDLGDYPMGKVDRLIARRLAGENR